jgi:hypothetical protein
VISFMPSHGGRAMRAARHPVNFAAPENSAAAEEAARLLLGGDDLVADESGHGRLSAHQTVHLRNASSSAAVTPGRVTLGTDACAAGPLLIVELGVEGSAVLSPDDFALITADGTWVPPEPACSADVRRLVFAVSAAGQLAYGPDHDAPGAVWDLRG